MMLRASVLVPIVVLMIATAAPAQSQEPSSGASLLKKGLLGLGAEPGRVSKPQLLQLPVVHEELKLTPQQKERLKDAEPESQAISKRVSSVQNQLRELREQGDVEAYQALRDEYAASITALTRESDKPLLKVLDSTQRTRLEQIQLQLEGPIAFSRPEIIQRLNLSPEQITEIAAIISQGTEMTARAAMMKDGTLPRGSRLTADQRKSLLVSKKSQAEINQGRDAVLKVRQGTMQKIGKLLTKRQREKYLNIVGEPFDSAKFRPDAKTNPSTPPQ